MAEQEHHNAQDPGGHLSGRRYRKQLAAFRAEVRAFRVPDLYDQTATMGAVTMHGTPSPVETGTTVGWQSPL